MSNLVSHLKRIRNVVSASCLLIGGGLTGALAQSGIADTSSRALEELERKQAEAYTLIERLEDVSDRMVEVLDDEKLLYHTTADATTGLHYKAPWTSLEKHLKQYDGYGDKYNIGTTADPVDLHGTDIITRNNPRHRVCLADGLSDAKIPHVGSNFAVLTYFDRGTYGVGVTPTELLAYAVSHSAKPGVVKGMPVGIGVIEMDGDNIKFTDVKGTSVNVSACLTNVNETEWDVLGGARLAIYHPEVKPEQLRFVLPKVKEVKRGSEFAPRPTGIYEACIDTEPTGTDVNSTAAKIIGRPQYSRNVFEQIAKGSSGNPLKDSANNPIDSDATKDAWANLLASTWSLDPLSCRARYTYRTTIEEDCEVTVGGVKDSNAKRRVGIGMREVMPVVVGGVATTRFYYEDNDSPTYEVDPEVARQEQASLCDVHTEIEIDLANAKVKQVDGDASEGSGVDRPSAGELPNANNFRAQCTPRSGNDADFAKLESLDKNTALSDFASLGLDTLGLDGNDPSLYYPHGRPNGGAGPTEVFNYYLKYAPAYAPMMGTHETQGMYHPDKGFVSANLANKPYFWDAVVRRPHQYRTDIDNPVAGSSNSQTITGLWGTTLWKWFSGQSSWGGQPTAWNSFRTRIGAKYVDWYDFDVNFPRPDGVTEEEFRLTKGLVRQAYGMWADSNTRLMGTLHPQLDDVVKPYKGLLRGDEAGLCASDYHDMAVMYRIYGQNYVKDVIAKTYGNVNVFNNHPDYGSLYSDFPLLEPPWYPVDHPFYQRHMEILTKAGYTRHTDNETMIAQIKNNFDAKKSEMESTRSDSDYKVISYDAQCGDWLVAEEYLGANDHTASDFATKFPGIKAMREKALEITSNAKGISISSRQNSSEASVEGGGDPREIPYHGLIGGIKDKDDSDAIGHIPYMSGDYRAGKLSDLFGKKKYVSGTSKKWARVTPCVDKPGHDPQTEASVYQ